MTLDSDIKKRAFYDISEYPEFQNIVDALPVILDELNKNTLWMKWGSDDYDPIGHCKFLAGDWTVCPIYFGNYSILTMNVGIKDGIDRMELLDILPRRFPEICKLFSKIKSINYTAFSRLHPKSKLAPHKHNNPACLIFHMGLVIPPGNTCGLSVNNEVHLWSKPGDAVIFDDNLEHSAWNDSDQERIILYSNFLR